MRKSDFLRIYAFFAQKRVLGYGTITTKQNGSRADEKTLLEYGLTDDHFNGSASTL